MSGKPTPGPWEVKQRANGTVCVGRVGLSIADGGVTDTWAQKPADARLIAAAPDMLEALKAALSVVQSACCAPDVEDKIHAAIAKAEGRS